MLQINVCSSALLGHHRQERSTNSRHEPLFLFCNKCKTDAKTNGALAPLREDPYVGCLYDRLMDFRSDVHHDVWWRTPGLTISRVPWAGPGVLCWRSNCRCL